MKKKAIIILLIILFLILFLIFGTLIWYNNSISGNKQNDEKIVIEVSEGSNINTVGSLLEKNGVIPSTFSFKIYSKLNKSNNVIAGKYCFSPSMTYEEITKMLKNGDIYKGDEIKLTYVEGKNIRWLARKIEELTNNKEEDVYDLLENEEYIDKIIKKYWFITDEIKNKDIYYSLEGYFFPDTYIIKNKDVTVEDIFLIMLNQMEKVLEEYKEDINNGNITVHQLLTIASMVELEGIHDEDRAGISGVFYNRIRQGMSLGSDVTTYYAWKVDMGERDLTYEELNTYNPYNTRGPNMQGKIPVGPISSVSKTSLEAALKPENTENLFFVADKNGKVYFTKTNAEHEQMVSALKAQGLWFEY